MNSLIGSLEFSVFGAALVLCLMGLWFAIFIPGIERWNRRFFTGFFFIFMLCCLLSISEVILSYYGVPRAMFIFLLLLESLMLSLPLLLLTVFLLHCSGESIRTNKLFYAVLGLWVILFILSITSLFVRGFFYLTPDDQLYRGPLYPLLILPSIAIQLFNLLGTIKRRKRLPGKVFLALLIAIVPITIALTAHLFIDIFPLIDISCVLSALAMYSLILSDQIERERRQEMEIVRQQQEIARERTSVMVLQMRPHFIYNTLMTIHSLCRLDPMKAQQITMDFTNYLRRNFNAIASDDTIPFSKELEHTRAYLAVEQAQYDDMLVVDYDTPYTKFHLPPLTLQPIVENSVKHGMDLNADPLHVTVQTYHTDLASVIIVKDNGSGFEPEANSKSHTTLTNIRQRLEWMCGGKIEILSQKAGGTIVKVTIPDHKS